MQLLGNTYKLKTESTLSIFLRPPSSPVYQIKNLQIMIRSPFWMSYLQMEPILPFFPFRLGWTFIQQKQLIEPFHYFICKLYKNFVAFELYNVSHPDSLQVCNFVLELFHQVGYKSLLVLVDFRHFQRVSGFVASFFEFIILSFFFILFFWHIYDIFNISLTSILSY